MEPIQQRAGLLPLREGLLAGRFPTPLPDRSQFNRLVRSQERLIEEVALHLATAMEAQRCPCQALDSSAMPGRDAKRRGEGWLAGRADIGWSNSLGWYEGFRLLVATVPTGVVRGFGFCAASATDQQVAETFFAIRHRPNSRLPSVGSAAWGPYVAYPRALKAKKTIGAGWNATGHASSTRPSAEQPQAELAQAPEERWVAGIRQIVESVYNKLFNTFGLWRERPHELSGLRARLAARVALHNFCMWLNEQLGRPRLAFADLLEW
jgi:hypothetical protein